MESEKIEVWENETPFEPEYPLLYNHAEVMSHKHRDWLIVPLQMGEMYGFVALDPMGEQLLGGEQTHLKSIEGAIEVGKAYSAM